MGHTVLQDSQVKARMTRNGKKLIFIKCCWGSSTDSKFTISETLLHMVALG